MADMVLLQITSTKSQYGSERRFSKGICVSELKGKLELITGVTALYMELELYNNKTFISSLDDSKMLGYYSPENNWILHVIDKNPNSKVGEFDDLSKVEKYELKEEEYDKREDSVRNFMKKNKMGKFSEAAKEAEVREAEVEKEEEAKGKTFKINDRCEVSIKNFPKQRGMIMYLGEVKFNKGFWVGVKYDEPLGKHDGSVKGERYFTCPPKYGGFVRPSQVEVGNFPEELDFMGDDEM
ncbi:tubulin-folding cofactor B isoform X2 [Hydra vulgaris]|uniref:Tubulin-folding cofactor B isoform X2 n=1 Tax=Hydra vulgaris TaxID=6087 RepID=A0ABM4CIB9_HYDVU